MALTINKVTKSVNLVTLEKYCKLSGETKCSIYSKKAKGVWLEGREIVKAPNGKLYVNVEKAQKWIIQSN